MGEVMARMQDLHQEIEAGGSAKARDKHLAKGKMLPREYVVVGIVLVLLLLKLTYLLVSRVTALTDAGSAFLELSALAGQDLYPGETVPAGGIITGVGIVQGIQCMIVANDST
jgi:3-methylcrotonyl-CoA carboxylase beta subunit